MRGHTVASLNHAKDKCPRGHQYDRTYTDKDGYTHRRCSQCLAERYRK